MYNSIPKKDEETGIPEVTYLRSRRERPTINAATT